MRSPLDLRDIEPAFCAMRNVLLAQPTQDVRLARPQDTTSYVLFEAILDGEPCKAYVETQALIDYWLGDVTVPINFLDPPVLQLFLGDSYRSNNMPFLMDGLTLYAPAQILYGKEIGHFLFHVSVSPFDLWLERLPLACRLPPPPVPTDLPVSLSWTLPGPTLRASDLVTLAVGDALRISNHPGIAWAGHTPITNFYLQRDHLMLVPHTEDAPIELEQYSDEICAAEDLPVQTTFLLTTQTLTVGEIASWKAGSTLPLPMTTPHVTVVSGSRILARGELVRVGETLAVELSEVKVAHDQLETEEPL